MSQFSGHIESICNKTIADGIAVGRPGDLTSLIQQYVDGGLHRNFASFIVTEL